MSRNDKSPPAGKSKVLLERFNELKLPYFRDNFETAVEQACAKQTPYLDLFSSLVEGEIGRRCENALRSRMRAAKLPYVKSLSTFQWSHPDKINRQQVESLFNLDFIDRKENVVFLGSCGMGKTHLALALAKEVCERGHSVLFAPAAEIVNTLSAAKANYALEKGFAKYVKPKVLVVDELGYLPIDKLGSDLLFQVVSARYERGSTIITTNKPFKKWVEIFNNDSTATSAILDRVLHHCSAVVIEGKSYRMKDRPE